MIIYDIDGTVLLNIEVDDSSAAYAEVMNRNDVTLEFSLAEHIEIPIGAYIDYNGRRYQLLVPATTTVVNRRYFQYTAVFETDEGKFRLWKVHNLVDGRVKFDLTARPSEHLAMFVGNLNEREGADIWAIAPGSYDSAEVNLPYNQTTIRDAINQLAEKCETEWEVYKSGNKIYLSLGKVEYNKANPIALSYGEDGGFESGVKRSNNDDGLPIQVLYVQGGDRNIDSSTYYNRSHSLLLPRNYSFSFDGEKFNGEDGFDATKAVAMVTDANGYSVRIASATRGAAEESLDLSDIYPKRVGTVSAVETVVSGGDYPFYNVADSTLGTEAGKVAIDFNDYMIEGEQFTIVFQSGMLVGREIGVHKYTLEDGRGVFELAQETIDGFIMPGEGGFIPAVGDTYAVFGCALPTAYIADAATHSGAEFDMLRKAAQYVYENKDAKQSFKGELSPVFARKNWTTIGPKIVLGGYVDFIDEDVQSESVAMRIMAIKTYINKPFKPEITLSNEATKGTVGGSIQSLYNNHAHTERQFYDARGYTNRRWRDAKESQDLLAEALMEEFSEGINPITIQTMSALVGSTNLQYEIYTSSSYSQIQGSPYFDDQGNLVCLGGYVKHYTLGFDENDYVKSSRPASEYFRWSLPNATLAPTDDGPYYLYIAATKLSQAGLGTATFLLSRTAIPFSPTADGSNYDTSHFYLLYATISSEIEGSRSLATYNGFTEITPGMIRAMKWISNDGYQFIDFINKAFRIGDANKFLGYNLDASGNVDGQGRLRFKGTLVQSPSGDSFPTPCNRGEYISNPATTYFYGDQVTYNGESWLHIGETATTGVAPSEGSVWHKTAAKGSDGANGAFKSIVFKRSASKPSQPEDGSYTAPVPSGWNDGIPEPASGQTIETPVWTTSHVFTYGETGTIEWEPIVQLTDTADIDFEFSAVESNPGDPTANSSNWHNTATSSDIWMAVRKGRNGVWESGGSHHGWEISKIKGERGAQGVSISEVGEYYAASTSGTVAPPDSAFVKGSIPSNFNATNKYLWNYEVISYSEGDPTKTAKTVIGVYGKDGKGLSSITEYYLATSASSNVTRNTSGWTTAMQYPDADKPYLWNYEKLTWTEGDPTYTDPAIIGHFGKDGTNGVDGKNGKVMRGRSEWSEYGYNNSGRYQGRDTATNADNMYIDIVLYRTNGEDLTYLCKKSHTASSSITPLDTEYWEEMSNFSMIATSALYAENALIENLGATRLNTDTDGVGYGVNIESNEIKVTNSSGNTALIKGGNGFDSADASGSISGTGTSKTGTKSGSGTVTQPVTCISGMSVSSASNSITVSQFTCNISVPQGQLYYECSIVAKLVSTGGDVIEVASKSGLNRSVMTFVVPQSKLSVKAGTWSLVVEFTAHFAQTSLTMGYDIGATSISGSYKSTANGTQIVGNGFKAAFGGEGFLATSSGAKIIRGNSEKNALASSTGKGFEFILPGEDYPSVSNMEDGVFYIKLSQASA